MGFPEENTPGWYSPLKMTAPLDCLEMLIFISCSLHAMIHKAKTIPVLHHVVLNRPSKSDFVKTLDVSYDIRMMKLNELGL